MDSDNEEREEEVPAWKGVSGTVVLINIYDPMQTNTPKQAYNATCEMLRGYMRESTSQMVGVCLYGTGKSCEAGVEGLRQIFSLKVPDLDDFLKTQVINPAAYGQAKEPKLSDALWHVNKMFANCKKLLSSKTVVLLTRADISPAESDQKPTLKRVVDLVDSGVELQIVNISETDYHVDKFYKLLLTEANKGNSDVAVPVPVWQLEDIVKQIQIHSHRNITIARFCLEIGEGLSIGVGLFNLTKSNIKPKQVLTDKDTNQICVRKTYDTAVEFNNEDEGDEDKAAPATVPLLKSEIQLYQTFGGERVVFTQDEINKIKNPFGPPAIKLLGFKPASVLSKEKWYVNPCYLLYPNESIMEGSTVAFNAMHKACMEMSAVAICVMCSRRNSKIKIVALSPCTKPLGLVEIKIGFDVIILPFAENVRNVQFESDCEIKETQKQMTKYIMEELAFDYKADMFENPFLQTLNRTIEALAFEEETVQPYKDKTVHDDDKFKNIDVEAFEEAFPGDFRQPPSKKPKLQVEEPVDPEELFKFRIKHQLLDKYSSKELKEIIIDKFDKFPGLSKIRKVKMIQILNDKYQK